MFTSGKKIYSVVSDRRVWRVFMVAMTLAFGVLYVVQVNAASTKGFTMRDLETKNQALQQENEKLAAEIDRLRSLDSVSERQAFLGLVKLQNVTYLKVASSDVALR